MSSETATIPACEVLDRPEMLRWLREEDESRLAMLFARADAVRRETVGDAVHLRGLIEVSNHCVRRCAYCGLHAGRTDLPRYRMTAEEVMACACDAARLGCGTVVLQAGEDYGLTTEAVAGLVRRIRRETPLAVTLSLGERSESELAAWREAGADRYLLRFETSDAALYRSIHPALPGRTSDRLAMLRVIRSFGYEIGGGVMVGIPGQTYESLICDIMTFAALDLDMIGIGPYIAHPAAPLGSMRCTPGAEQVPNTELMTRKMIALSRLACPESNIPSTTALAAIDARSGYEGGLAAGANVIMPNLTPARYRALYEIYPAKAAVLDAPEDVVRCLRDRIRAAGRVVGSGAGGRIRRPRARAATGSERVSLG